MAIQDDIIYKVDQKEKDTQKLRQRMSDDYLLWLNDPYAGMDAGFEVYTTNEPVTYGRKNVSIQSSAAMTLRVPQNNDDRVTRDQDNAKEQFLRGNFRANDSRLGLLGRPSLRQSMSFTVPILGYTCGRALLVKYRDRVWADATPWDPKETIWEYGSFGLAYICHKYYKLRSQIEAEYGVKAETNADTDVLVCYDYYDDRRNYMLIPGVQETPIKNERHGLDRVPGWVVAATIQPPIVRDAPVGESMSSLQLADSLADYGESIYKDNRRIYGDYNFVLSILKEFAKRSLKPVYGIESESGGKVVEGNPFEAGAEIPLRSGEKLNVYDFLQAAPDMIPYVTALQREMQMGAFSSITRGEAPATISGFAMQTLKSADADKVTPSAQAQSVALTQIANLWCDHFMTGAFGSMELSGEGSNRKWFSSRIDPQMIRDLPEPIIEIVPQLPEDDAGKVQQALALRQPGSNGLPLYSDYTIREEVLQRQDSDRDVDSILEEMASRHPMVLAARLTDALAKRGDTDAASVWFAEWMRTGIQMVQQGLPLTNISPPGGGNGNGGFTPETLPNSVQGLPSPTPGVDTPYQNGPLVERGRERPGAQSPNGRLRQGVPPIP